MVDFLNFVSCQLVAKFILLTAGFRLSWRKTEKKNWNKVAADEKLLLKTWFIE